MIWHGSLGRFVQQPNLLNAAKRTGGRRSLRVVGIENNDFDCHVRSLLMLPIGTTPKYSMSVGYLPCTYYQAAAGKHFPTVDKLLDSPGLLGYGGAVFPHMMFVSFGA